MEKPKKFEFPENINGSYGIFLGLSLKEIGLYIVPTIIVGLIILFLPPYDFMLMMIKFFFVLIALTFVVAILSSKPVKHRDNIRLIPFLKMKNDYSHRQKLYFINSKRKENK